MRNLKTTIVLLSLLTCLAWSANDAMADGRVTVAGTIDRVQPRLAKIYGAGGFRGLEPYQSGMLISPDGHILTTFSYVLDTDDISVTLADGRRFDAQLLGADPRLEVAVLKIEATDLDCFELAGAVEVEAGARILAISNLFGVAIGDEPASVQHGVVAVKTTLQARRGTFETLYEGPVYVLDVVTNNPGAAGGALLTRHGELIGMLGKELRNAMNNTWLNHAIPIGELRESVQAIRDGTFNAQRTEPVVRKPERALQLDMLGLMLVPDVLQRTPPYIDNVRPGSTAAEAGLRPDDLVLLLNDRLIRSCKSLREELEFIDFEDQIKLTVLRGQELLEVALQVSAEDLQESP